MIGPRRSSAMLDFSGLASFHNGFAVLREREREREREKRVRGSFEIGIVSPRIPLHRWHVCVFFLVSYVRFLSGSCIAGVTLKSYALVVISTFD